MTSYPPYLVYPAYTGVLLIATFALVPRQDIRRLLRYAVLFGAVGDLISILLAQLIGMGGYTHYGPFAFLGIPFFPLIAWSSYFVIYLYLLPPGKTWSYIFPVISALYSVLFSNVLHNLGIFQWNLGTLLAPFILYLVWHGAVTWIYRIVNDVKV
ncbi:hypothetical protein CEB3_c11880 [Peptococcaceae bacterium CEB3]|nr:hypothetical protein CEB3_c11880 [Peptococcaceae bacterium CEB3]